MKPMESKEKKPRRDPSWKPALGLLLAMGLGACAPARARQDDGLSAGAATVFDTTRDAFSLPMPNLTESERRAFFVGNSFFNQNWVEAPASVGSRDGLGPLFNARSCSGCHFKDGRGRPPDARQPLDSMLLRVSVPGTDAKGGPLPHPQYGGQIQGAALPGVAPEAEVAIEYSEVAGRYADGTTFHLRTPRYRLDHAAYGETGPSLLLSARVAPALVGLGLLEAVSDEEISRLADPDDRDRDGISGRMNQVWNVRTQRRVRGRFGWKAEQPTVEQQTAGAFAGDMGLTSSLFPTDNLSPAQASAIERPSGGSPEVDDVTLRAVVSYVRTLGVPAARPLASDAKEQGSQLFARLGCTSCHVPSLTTGPVADLPGLSEQEIHPYTDLLLHDMGKALTDGRPSYGATGSEWRTAPLWGLGLYAKVNGHTLLLHDGRARNVAEAILFHGGEAEAARRAFVEATAQERKTLIAFIEAL